MTPFPQTKLSHWWHCSPFQIHSLLSLFFFAFADFWWEFLNFLEFFLAWRNDLTFLRFMILMHKIRGKCVTLEQMEIF